MLVEDPSEESFQMDKNRGKALNQDKKDRED